jgi:hypothetical protein
MGKTLRIICFLTYFGGVLSGCSTGMQTAESSAPINAIYASIENNLSMGIQGYSENRREITSRPFIVQQSSKAKKGGHHERGVAKVNILGGERPYTLQVTVAIESANGGGDDDYTISRYDERLATKLLKDILATIKKYERSKNVIDDFRSF